MQVANPARRFPVVLFFVAAVCQSSYADTKEPDKSFQANKLPPFEFMLATAVKHNPIVRAAQAELDRARLQAAREIRAFRDEWQAQLATVTSAEMATRDAERLSAVPGGAITGKKLQEAKQLVESSRRRESLAQAKLKELKSMSPLLLGTAIRAEPAGDDHPGHTQEAHGHHHPDHHTIPAPVEKLLRERLQVLVEVAKLQQAAYKTQEVGFDAVSSAQMEILGAKLELAKSTDDRLKIRQQMRQIAREVEKTTTALFQANEATQVDLLKAKALRLRAEADLSREQSATKHEH